MPEMTKVVTEPLEALEILGAVQLNECSDRLQTFRTMMLPNKRIIVVWTYEEKVDFFYRGKAYSNEELISELLSYSK